jgi:hypothetical protein
MLLTFVRHEDVEERAVNGDHRHEHGDEAEEQPHVAPASGLVHETGEQGCQELHRVWRDGAVKTGRIVEVAAPAGESEMEQLALRSTRRGRRLIVAAHMNRKQTQCAARSSPLPHPPCLRALRG